MRILIVDDSSTMRRIIGNVVQQLGVPKEDFDEAEDGVVAWNVVNIRECFQTIADVPTLCNESIATVIK